MDTEGLTAGGDYVKRLLAEIEQCSVVLVVIGKGWIDAADRDGRRRLEQVDDWVRAEVETAFQLGKVVVPVLVNGASLPSVDRLPHLMRPLVDRQAVRIDHDTFNSDAARLMDALKAVLDQLREEKTREKKALDRQEAVIGKWRTLTRIEIDRRAAHGVEPESLVRIVPHSDQIPSHLGREEAVYVFCGDYHEYKGRFLKDILRDMYSCYNESQTRYIAIKCPVRPEENSGYKFSHATLDVAYRILTGQQIAPLEWVKPSAPHTFGEVHAFNKIAALGQRNWIDLAGDIRERYRDILPDVPLGSHDYLLSRITHQLVSKAFGIDATYQHEGRGRSEFSARHLFFPNLKLADIDFEIQQMGRPSDLIALY